MFCEYQTASDKGYFFADDDSAPWKEKFFQNVPKDECKGTGRKTPEFQFHKGFILIKCALYMTRGGQLWYYMIKYKNLWD